MMLRLFPLIGALLVIPGCSSLARVDYTRVFSRAGWQRPADVIAALDLAAGDRVADIGAGEGYFTFLLADAVGPTGRVYAVEIDPERIASLERKVQERGYSNVEVIAAKPDDPLLSDASIDVVFLCNAYHHIDARVAYFERLRRDLSGRGRVAVVEVGDRWLVRRIVPRGHFTPLQQLHSEMRQAHYVPVASFDFLPLQNFEVFADAD